MQLYSLVVTLDARVRAELAPCHFNQAMVTEAHCVVASAADRPPSSYGRLARRDGRNVTLRYVTYRTDRPTEPTALRYVPYRPTDRRPSVRRPPYRPYGRRRPVRRTGRRTAAVGRSFVVVTSDSVPPYRPTTSDVRRLRPPFHRTVPGTTRYPVPEPVR